MFLTQMGTCGSCHVLGKQIILDLCLHLFISLASAMLTVETVSDFSFPLTITYDLV